MIMKPIANQTKSSIFNLQSSIIIVLVLLFPALSYASFTDNGDGTITDDSTGLAWSQDANHGISNWQGALVYVVGLNASAYLGYTDWQLPSIGEFQDLISNRTGTSTAYWLSSQGFTNVQKDYYWSSTSDADRTNNAWLVYMGNGVVLSIVKTDYVYVWPVRSGSGGSLSNSDISVSPASHNFGNATVGDTSTAQSFTLSNIGSVNLIIGTINLTGTDATEFSIQNDLCSVQTIAPSGSCTVEAVFSPTVQATASANLSIPSNDPDTPTLDVPLSGTGTDTCTYSIIPTSISTDYSAVTDSVDVSSPASCGWKAVTNDPDWITVESGSSGSGDGTVTYAVSENTKTTPRTGTITIAGKTFTVTQNDQMYAGPILNGKAITTAFYFPDQRTIGFGGIPVDSVVGAGVEISASPQGYPIASIDFSDTSILLTFSQDLQGSRPTFNGWRFYDFYNTISAFTGTTLTTALNGWSVSSDADNIWLNGSGAYFTTGSTLRIDIVADSTTTTCTYSISPTSQTFNYSAATDSVDVGDTDICGWTAVTNDPDWITVESGSSGSGDGTVTYSVTENTKTTSRTGAITIAGKTFTITQNGTGIIDNTDPSVKIDSPGDGSTPELVYFINGTSFDGAPSSGIDRVEIQVSDGSGNYLDPDDDSWGTVKQWIITAREAEVWFYDTSNVAWENNVGYEVAAKVYDNAGNSGEAVIFFTFQEIEKQLPSTLGLTLSSNAILQGNTIDVSGKLTRRPDDGTDISGNTIKITITAPDSAVTSQSATTESDGGYQIAGISGFTQKGTYTIQASFGGTSEMAASSPVEVSLLQVGFAGYAIIVEGKFSSQEGLDSHNKTTNNIYNALLERGFTKDNIYYYNYDVTQDVDNDGNVDDIDGVPSKTAIQNAISELAKDKMNSAPAPLYVILHDHGSTDKFYMGDEVLSPAELDSWLDTLDSGLNSNALLEKRIIFYGACYSGSFISALSKASTVTDGGRVIVTSAASDEESYKGPMEPDGIRSGSYFLEEFFGDLKRGYSIKDSFEKATGRTEIFTRKGGGPATSNTNNAYFDNAMQHPLLDDGGDGVGSNVLSDNIGDGQVAKDIYLGVGETLEALPDSQAEILYVTETLYISPFETDHLLWAAVNNNDQIESAWMEIRKPSQTLSGTGGTNQLSTDYEKIPLSLNDATGNWEGTVSFPSGGLYEVFYFVSDNTTGEASAPMRSIVYKDKVGNNPPHIFSLDSPPPVSEEKTSAIFRWNAASGPDGEDTTYTYSLLIATDEEFNNVVYKKEEIITTAAIVDSDAGLSDLAIYYWKVQAVDAYGLITDSAQTWPFFTNNTNFGFGYITGIVYDAGSFAPIVGATVKTDFGDEDATRTEGYYIMSANEGAYTVTCSFDGYPDTSFSGISVSNGKTTELNIPLTSSVTSTDSAPDIKANGSDGPVTISQGDLLTVKVSLDPESHGGENADWWVYATTSFGKYWYTLDPGWQPSSTPKRVYGGPLFSLAPYTILEMSTLPIGDYTFSFEVDDNMDNVKDGTYTDSVEVTIK